MQRSDSSVLNWDESKQFNCTPMVDAIRELRDVYKEGTERTVNEIKARLEQESAQKRQEAEKAMSLLELCRQSLQQLDEQHKCIGRNLKAPVEQGRALTVQIRQEVERCTHAELAMRQLIIELRNKNQ
ncbi:PREDICTED: uncharacterized protein LOC108370404 [Rhagoletis zephyria]|uniref:uncharacterized protein LOC108370404 n=1 Tax=Rhagoletis zephyria TaxID=28612 RepID=UPI0008117583|nr:PREDICTED: uncharacterized protein LOC108370404 [Rhagoletis zephyria]XP_036324383.1 uncharacterized protein LOC118737756 [Rhagoletis pomonella]